MSAAPGLARLADARGARLASPAAGASDATCATRATHAPGAALLPWPVAALLAAVSAAATVAALPPLDAWPLAFVGWAPLLVALRGRGPRQAALLGALQGLLAQALGMAWLPGVVKSFVSVSTAGAVAISLLVWAYGAGRTALIAWATARATKRGGPAHVSQSVAFLLALAACETSYPLLLPWTSAAQVHRVPLLMQAAELGGPVLVTVLLACSSVAVAELGEALLARRALRRAPLAFLLGPLLLTLYGAVRIPAVRREIEHAAAGNVGIVQANVPHSGASMHDSLAAHAAATRALTAAGGLDLVVWPESAFSDLLTRDALPRVFAAHLGPTRAPGGPLVSAPVLSGALVSESGRLSNAAVLFDRAGQVEGLYRKRRPLPFGETLPFEGAFPWLRRWLPNTGQITPGADAAPLVVGNHRVTVLICYEAVLPAFANEAVAQGDPDLIVNVTNDAWFGRSNVAQMHLALATLRAVEHRRYLVSAANSGISAIVDPTGRVVAQTGLLTAATLGGEVRWMRARTPYERVGDAPGGAAALALVAMAFASSRRGRGRGRRAESRSPPSSP